MKACIEKEEWYPVFVIDTAFLSTDTVDIPDEICCKYHIALEQWKSIQSELRKIYYKHN